MCSNKQNLGVVILNYNSHDLTVALANRFDSLDSVSHICVVDNDSKDDFNNDFNSEKIKYIKNKSNTGYNAGNNVGLRYLVEEKNCDIVFIANPDIHFDGDIVSEMAEALYRNEDIAILSTKRFGADGDQILQYMTFPTWKESMRACFFLTRRGVEAGKIKEQNDRVNGADGILYVDSVPGAFFALRSSFLLEIGFLYEGLFLYGEELVLGRQVLNAGKKAAVINTAEYCHDHKRRLFANKTMFLNDRISLLKYYKKFDLLTPFQFFLLKISVHLGALEYRLGYAVYWLLHS